MFLNSELKYKPQDQIISEIHNDEHIFTTLMVNSVLNKIHVHISLMTYSLLHLKRNWHFGIIKKVLFQSSCFAFVENCN